ncbi:MAG TPA: hypothetical protein VFW77_00945 [Candidatus Saccharimonadales bacterium]|nr:hypothetical protein [Candidatus Saccharimonadales bacterium]
MILHKLLNSQTGTTVVAEMLITLLVLGAAAFGGYRIHQHSTAVAVCDSKSCFEKKFSACEKASYTVRSKYDGTFYSEIYGPKDDGCSMLTRYTYYPNNPDWVNKDLVCTYDNSVGFDESISSTIQKAAVGQSTSCEGPFLKVLQNL